MFYTELQEIIGQAPIGYEPLQYIMSGLIFIFILVNCFNLIGGIVKKLGGL